MCVCVCLDKLAAAAGLDEGLVSQKSVSDLPLDLSNPCQIRAP